jgi:hypothetical protein
MDLTSSSMEGAAADRPGIGRIDAGSLGASSCGARPRPAAGRQLSAHSVRRRSRWK